jgi:cellobiose phosphorylase
MANVVAEFKKSLENKWSRVSLLPSPRPTGLDQPLREGIFNLEQLADHGRAIALAHRLEPGHGTNRLLSRLDENERLLQAYNRATLAVDKKRRVTPAAEWLLDNFYLIEEQIQLARRHLPSNYSRELPTLANGPSAKLPRVYDLVLELIAHVDAQIDAEPLRVFVAAYQSVSPLNLGELWAIPIMLRLALIENLRRITSLLTFNRHDRDLADQWADRLQEAVDHQGSKLLLVVADMAKAELPWSTAFITEFSQRLARMDPSVQFARSWVEQILAEQGQSIDQFAHAESQSQAADQVSVSHTILSLRFLGTTDWRKFVEAMSVVEQNLRRDPSEFYAKMDFQTRDSYRHGVEHIARHSELSETEVANKAVELAAEEAKAKGKESRTAHVGYFLVDKGRPILEQAAKATLPLRARFERLIQKYPMGFYSGGLLAIVLPATYGLLAGYWRLGVGRWAMAVIGLVALVCFSQFAVGVVNWLATILIRPRHLPRLDFSKGIRSDCRTMVVVPTMLSSAEAIDRLVETLEIHYLGNRDDQLSFALLTDFRDAPQESTPEDAALLDQVVEGVELLNQKYAREGATIFFLFHRPRLWNPNEGVWMGYERKRGKLGEFNALLRGRGKERFSKIVGDLSSVTGIKFVITLDTDTQLPRDAARRLVGTIAHPLNRPEFSPTNGVVVDGYSILQPRVGVSLPSASRSWFVRIFAGDAGIDPYTREVSDVYQDVFNEGSFIGKGIYDVDAFEEAVRGRFPENTILSHDLVESLHARSALVSDVELFEEHPSRYNADINRRHRWIRGDWQISQWLLPRVPGPDARSIENPLSGLSRWKIFDNLRRSLVPTAMTLLLLGSWLVLPEAYIGSAVVLAIVFIPGLLAVLVDMLKKPKEWPWFLHLNATVRGAGRQLCQVLLTLAFLPYDAFISLDAIARTLVRLCITRKRMLEWQTASDAERNARTGFADFYRTMWIAPAISFATLLYLTVRRPEVLPVALPFLLIWVIAPAVACWISRPIIPKKPELTQSQLEFLGRTARRTWRYFETFVTAEENWLPPDNFQEHPIPTIASRTSPTNIGMALLANLAATDFGYLSVRGLIERTVNTFNTMERMERYRGHFFNWYNTRTLAPLLPNYISTVDSGNLAGHLLTLSAGFREYTERPIVHLKIFQGLRDTLGVLQETQARHEACARLEKLLAQEPADLPGYYQLLTQLEKESVALPSTDAFNAEEKHWAAVFVRTCREHAEDLLLLAPWLPTLSAAKSTGEEVKELTRIPNLREIAELTTADAPAAWSASVEQAAQRARERIQTLEALERQAQALATMDNSFLFDTTRELFTIGYNVTDRRRDASFYDLLSSEARLGSYTAIAQGQVPENHWFSLGRLLVSTHGQPILVSWGGSMFEYLMPQLVMPMYDNTLIDQTCRAVVDAQIAYGQTCGTPWGISESGYNLTDAQMNYQYKSFGVPGLGFKRGLGDGLVIAPYASALALMVAPREACENLQRLAAEGRVGAYGFFEAVDYTPARLPPNETSVTIKSFMAHHEGMTLLSLAYLLLEKPMQRRFLGYAPFKAEELLLQERVPKVVNSISSTEVELTETRPAAEGEGMMRIYTSPHTSWPEVHLLSNGRYHVVVSAAGGGYSRWQDMAVTRWREDSTEDGWGNFCYLREVDSAETWSIGYQPTHQLGKRYEAIFTQARAEFRQRHGHFEMHVEIAVSPEDDLELRRVDITNHSTAARTVELTTYAEVVLAPAAADAAHPAFSNLFVQTEFVSSHPAILCTRRPRSQGEKPPWLFHMMTAAGAEAGGVSYETDRAKFVGRGRRLTSPLAMAQAGPLSNTAGAVLDPVVSLRRTVTIPAQETVRVEIAMGVAATREAAVALVNKYQNTRMADRVFDLAWTHSQVTLRQLDATEREAQLYARMAGALIYAHPSRRSSSGVLVNNRRGQSGLWSFGISGDSPIVLVRMSEAKNLDIVRRLVQAHTYWRTKGLTVELVIINDEASVYRQTLQESILSIIAASSASQTMNKAGGVFAPRSEQISPEDRVLLQSAARIALFDDKGTLEEQFQRRPAPEPALPELRPTRTSTPDSPVTLPDRGVLFFNGLGGFAGDGREYVITLESGGALPAARKNPVGRRFSAWLERAEPAEPDASRIMTTPAPWVNVLANARFGTVISESGGAYTWLDNSHEFRLTPWNNDPVSDVTGEAFYIRDDETGEFWSPFPLPVRGRSPYIARHGFGYSAFEHVEHGISSEVWVYVAKDAPVKFTVFKIKNISGRHRQLSLYGYWEWVLNDLRSKSLLHVQTEIDSVSGALLARNRYNTEFADRVAFVDVSMPGRTFTGDRREFIGRNGSLADPVALKRTRLSGKTGAGLDPCAALQVALELPENRETDVSFRLGAGRDLGEAQELVQRFRRPNANRDALHEVRSFWTRTLGAVQVETPDPATNLLANGWLIYQTLSARFWGRTGFYQSGGAFGFRDQLQDAMAFVHTEPALLQEQIFRAAAHQFREGDVQHWWHPPSDRGVRTHFSDDFLWLPYATCRYIHCLNDLSILDKIIPFLEGRMLKPEEESYYDLPAHSTESVTLYEHCVRAIEHGLRFGAHGLPLIGCGDWNDGFNLIGEKGRGESVWLGFFLYDILTQFSEVAQRRRDLPFAQRCQEQAELLRKNLEAQAWDGEWYRRAYFDNGDPVGSKQNMECQIDSLPQSWSILSQAGDQERARMAMQAVNKRLVRRDARLIQLFDPPFDKSPDNPGYIKGYLPGVRENGGQYTHGAIWTVMAMAQLGETDLAWELLDLLNPVNHTKSAAQVATYKTEPYVVAADVYAVPPHVGRGGWTWYTGSAGWMYRLIIESLLGLKLENGRLRVRPLVPARWPGLKMQYRYKETIYKINVTRTPDAVDGEIHLDLDGRPLAEGTIPLTDDRVEHQVQVRLGTPRTSRPHPDERPSAPAPVPT